MNRNYTLTNGKGSVYTITETGFVVSLRSLNDSYVNDYGMIMSGTLWATAPLIAIFLLFNRFFINSLTQGAVKG